MSANFNLEWQSASGLPVVGPFFEGELTPTILNQLYPLLQYPFSGEAVQKASKAQTKKGYDTTGVGYQFLVNRMNEVLGPSHWGYYQEIIKEIAGEWSNKPNVTLAVETTVEIGNYVEGQFVPLHKVTGIGGHTGAEWPDTLKGAQSNSLKKALGFLGVGREAYEGTLDDDNRSDLSKNGNPSQITASQNMTTKQTQQQVSQNKETNKQTQPQNFTPVEIPNGNSNTGNSGKKNQNNTANSSIFSGQIVLTGTPVMKNGKASVTGVIIEEDIEVEVCGWASQGMVEEVMAMKSGQVLDVQGAQRRETERFGIQISLKKGIFSYAA